MTSSVHSMIARWRMGLITAAALLALPVGAAAQGACSAEEWPCNTIQVTSHASAGGGTDTTIRMWLDAAREQVDESMRVVYKQGGGARAAHEYLLNRGPDGHTIFAFTQTHLYTVARGNSPTSLEQMQGVARAMDDPSIIVVRANSPYENYEEFVAAAEEEPMTFGVAQVGGTEHIGISRWAEASGAQVRVVPFGGGGDMITSLRSGAVEASVANFSEALSLVQEGELRALALLYPERLSDLPDVPSVYEHGHEISVTTTRGYYVHAETDPEIVDKIESMVLAAMDGERFRDYLRTNGLDPEMNIAGADTWDSQMTQQYQVALDALRKLDMTDR